MEIYILIFAIFLLLVFLFRSSVDRGQYGEYLVANEIGSLDQDKYISFHGIALKTPDGSTQIDHVLISQYGIVEYPWLYAQLLKDLTLERNFGVAQDFLPVV